MAYTDTLLATQQDDVLMMNPERGGAEFGEEGSGATSGYGDTTEDDLSNEDEEVDDPLETDPDDELQGDDLDNDDDI